MSNAPKCVRLPPGRRVAADDKLLLVVELELDPCTAAPAGFVGGPGALADQAFEADRPRLRQERVRIGAQRGGVADHAGGRASEEFFKARVALGEREIDEALTVETEQVEHVVMKRRLRVAEFVGL